MTPSRAHRFSPAHAGIRLVTAQPGSPGAAKDCLRECMIGLLAERGPGRSVCPSEVARVSAMRIGGRWQDLMPQVRAMARTLAAEGIVEAIQHEGVVVLHEVRGPVRLRLCRYP